MIERRGPQAGAPVAGDFGECAACGEELVGRALFDDASPIEDHHVVGVVRDARLARGCSVLGSPFWCVALLLAWGRPSALCMLDC